MKKDVDRAVAALAASQHGVFTAAQATLAGASRDLRSRRVLAGRWQLVHPGVYAIAGWSRTFEARALAAAWSLRGGAVSHQAAGRLLRIDAARDADVSVSVRRGGHQPRPFTVHEVRWLPDEDLASVGVIPTTALARPVVDLSTVWAAPALERTLDDLVVAGRTTVTKVSQAALPLLARGRQGAAELAALLEARGDGEPVAESALEAALHDLVARGGYGPIRRQAGLAPLPAGARVDGLLVRVGVVLEADGRRWHARMADFERDRARDNALQAEGYAVARFTHATLVEDPGAAMRILDRHFLRQGWRRDASGLWVRDDAA